MEKRRKRSQGPKRKGFTLTELLIVVSILAILAYGVWRAYKGYVAETKATKIAQEVSNITSALNLFQQQTGYMPDSVQELWVNDDGSGNPIPGWQGPYIEPPGGDTTATSLKSGSGATITVACDSTNGEQIVFTNVPKNVAESYDEKYDDGNLSSGNAVYDDTNHTLTVIINKNATCI